MRISMLLSSLVASLTIQGCTTLSTETNDPSLAAATMILRICNEAWKPIHYASKHDTPETVEEARANNRARAAFCK